MNRVVNDRLDNMQLQICSFLRALWLLHLLQVTLGSGLPRDSPMTGFIVWGQVFPPLKKPRAVPSPYPPELG